jgi:hypothetical protein
LGGLVSKPAGLRAVEVAVIQSRRQILANLQALVTAPDTSETDMQKILQDNHWIFGGRC